MKIIKIGSKSSKNTFFTPKWVPTRKCTKTRSSKHVLVSDWEGECFSWFQITPLFRVFSTLFGVPYKIIVFDTFWPIFDDFWHVLMIIDDYKHWLSCYKHNISYIQCYKDIHDSKMMLLIITCITSLFLMFLSHTRDDL